MNALKGSPGSQWRIMRWAGVGGGLAYKGLSAETQRTNKSQARRLRGGGGGWRGHIYIRDVSSQSPGA